MNGQLGIVAVMVAGAAAYLLRQTWRTWTGKKAGCGKGCDCSGTAVKQPNNPVTFIPSDQLGLRRARSQE